MAKKSGLGSELYVEGFNLSGDIGQLNEISDVINHRQNQGSNASAVSRVQLTRMGHISFTGYFNDAAGRSIPVLKNPSTSNVIATFLQSTTIGSVSCGISGHQAQFGGTRGADGSLDLTTRIDSNGYPGVEWGRTLTGGRVTHNAASQEDGVDDVEGSLSFGAAFYLQHGLFTGTSITLVVQESSDNGSGDAWANVTGGSFVAVSASNSAQRIETSLTQTVERYLRIASFGTFSNAQFQVTAVRYRSGDRGAA